MIGESGEQWIRTFTHPLTPEKLLAGLAEPTPTELPDLRSNDPAEVAARLLEFFATLRD